MSAHLLRYTTRFVYSYFVFISIGYIYQIHKPIVFSTSPSAKYTHWKQTVFYLKEPLTVCAGEEFTGTIVCSPNDRNKRDLDINIEYEFSGGHSDPIRHSQLFHLR